MQQPQCILIALHWGCWACAFIKAEPITKVENSRPFLSEHAQDTKYWNDYKYHESKDIYLSSMRKEEKTFLWDQHRSSCPKKRRAHVWTHHEKRTISQKVEMDEE